MFYKTFRGSLALGLDRPKHNRAVHREILSSFFSRMNKTQLSQKISGLVKWDVCFVRDRRLKNPRDTEVSIYSNFEVLISLVLHPTQMNIKFFVHFLALSMV